MSDSVRPHRRQPTRLPRPWDSPGKNTGVGCHFLFPSNCRCCLNCAAHITEQDAWWGTEVYSEPEGIRIPEALTSRAGLLLFSHSVVSDFATPWTVARQASLSFTTSRSLLKLTSIDLMLSHISYFVSPFSSRPQSFPESGSSPMSWLFASGGQSTGASASASVLLINLQG